MLDQIKVNCNLKNFFIICPHLFALFFFFFEKYFSFCIKKEKKSGKYKSTRLVDNTHDSSILLTTNHL